MDRDFLKELLGIQSKLAELATGKVPDESMLDLLQKLQKEWVFPYRHTSEAKDNLHARCSPEEDGPLGNIPPTNIREDHEQLLIEMNTPGIESREQIEISIQGEHLLVKAHTGNNQQFFQKLFLPPGIDRNDVQGTYEKGWLKLVFKKMNGKQGSPIEIQFL